MLLYFLWLVTLPYHNDNPRRKTMLIFQRGVIRMNTKKSFISLL